MPNLKIYVSDALWHEKSADLIASLEPVRGLLCDGFRVDPEACQIAILPVRGLLDQPQVAVEIHIMPRLERTRDAIRTVARNLQDLLHEASGTHVAVRVSLLDPVTYVVLK